MVAAILGVLGLLLVIGALNLVTFGLPRMYLRKRQDFKNRERAGLAMRMGWQFRPHGPDLLGRYPFPPFTERGDRRQAFGVLSGVVEGVPFVMFDFQLRQKVTYNSLVVVTEKNAVHTVFAMRLPAPGPPVRVAVRGLRLAIGRSTEPQTPDYEFNKRYLLDDTDPATANQVLTAQVMAIIRDCRISNVTIQGEELVFSIANLTRTTADEIMMRLQQLAALVRALPAEAFPRSAPPPGRPVQHRPVPGYGVPGAFPPPGYYPPPGYPPQHPGYAPRR